MPSGTEFIKHEFDASLGGRNRPRTVELFRTVAERLEAVPGVQSVSIAASTPYSLAGDSRSVRRAERQTIPPK